MDEIGKGPYWAEGIPSDQLGALQHAEYRKAIEAKGAALIWALPAVGWFGMAFADPGVPALFCLWLSGFCVGGLWCRLRQWQQHAAREGRLTAQLLSRHPTATCLR